MMVRSKEGWAPESGHGEPRRSEIRALAWRALFQKRGGPQRPVVRKYGLMRVSHPSCVALTVTWLVWCQGRALLTSHALHRKLQN